MERITYRITLDAYKNGTQRTLQGFETGDNVSRRLAINLVSGGDTFEIAQDVIAMIYVHNGSVPSINACEIVDNTIIYDVLPITEEGIFEMQVKLIEVGINGAQKVLVAPKFAVEVTESGTGDGGATGTTTFTALENALAKAEAVYNSRIIGVEIDDDCTFKVMYADGTVYENDYLKEALYNGNALLSESFAHGNTGIREGENTDNAKYYSNVSKSASEDAKIVSDEARVLLNEAMLKTTFTAFKVDFESGELTYMSANYNFDVNEETGNLEADPEGGYNPEELIGTVVDEFIDKKSEEINEDIEALDTRLTELEKSGGSAEGGAGAVELTQAEYDNLSEEEKQADVIYFVTDGDVEEEKDFEFGTIVTINNCYTNNWYTFPSDGYIRVISNAGSEIAFKVLPNSLKEALYVPLCSKNQEIVMSVYKGMKFGFTDISHCSLASAIFVPFE